MKPSRVDRAKAYLLQLLAKRGDISFRGLLLVMAAGAACGITAHSLILDELGLVRASWIGLTITLLAAVACTGFAVHDLKPR